jgi:hypothetical protein
VQARQTTGVGSKHFQTTSKTRVAHTNDELTKFANSLRKFDKASTVHLNSVKGARLLMQCCAGRLRKPATDEWDVSIVTDQRQPAATLRLFACVRMRGLCSSRKRAQAALSAPPRG